MEIQENSAKKGMNSFSLKIIAIIGMTLDHIGIVFESYLPWWGKTLLFAFGGLTFPIMAYFIGEGYRHTKNFKKYAFKMLLFAVITQPIYNFILYKQLNVLFTLLLGLLAIHIKEKVENKLIVNVSIIVFIMISFYSDWGVIGVPMVLLYYYLKDNRARLYVPIIFPYVMIFLTTIIAVILNEINLTQALPQIMYVLVGCTITIPLLSSYNGQQGRKAKYLFYMYYPAHIAILGVILHFLFIDK